MCGIYGWQWANAPKSSDTFVLNSVLAALNQQRGADSWGFYTPAHDNLQECLYKKLGAITADRRFRGIHHAKSALIHTRFKTMGAVNVKNAHPFEIENIIGAHNGCIWNANELDLKYNRRFDVDSMHIFAHLNEGHSLFELDGYGAIEYIDKRLPGRIYLCRFDTGDLAVRMSKRYGTIWSSDEDHLDAALNAARLGNQFKAMKVDRCRAYFVENGVFYQTPTHHMVSQQTKGFGFYSYYGSHSDNWDKGYRVTDTRASKNPTKDPLVKDASDEDDVEIEFEVDPNFEKKLELDDIIDEQIASSSREQVRRVHNLIDGGGGGELDDLDLIESAARDPWDDHLDNVRKYKRVTREDSVFKHIRRQVRQAGRGA